MTTRAAKQPKIPTPYPHQLEALDAIDQQLRLTNGIMLHPQSCLRGLCVMACGTGKTMVGAFAAQRMWDSAERQARKGGFNPVYAPVLVLVPSLQLAAQTVREWENVFPGDQLQRGIMCSETTLSIDNKESQNDDTVSSNHPGQLDDTDNKTASALLHGGRALLRNTKEVDSWLRIVASRQRRLVVSTYHSLQHMAAADVVWGLIIEDEAHHYASHDVVPSRSQPGQIKNTKLNKVYSPVLGREYPKALRRLALTATPHPAMVGGYEDGVHQPVPEFGPLVYNLPFSEAVHRGLLSHYRVVIQVKTYQDLAKYVREHYMGSDSQLTVDQIVDQIRADDLQVEIEVDGEIVRMSPHNLLCHITTSKFMSQHNLPRAAVFRSTIHHPNQRAKHHTKMMVEIPQGSSTESQHQSLHDASVLVKHINENNLTSHCEAVLDGLRDLKSQSGEPIEAYIVCNAQCVSEGIDAPALDLVVLAEMRQSSEQLAQIICRVMRKDPKGTKKVGCVLVPLLVDEAVLTDKERFVKSPVLQYVRSIIEALSINDDMLVGGEQEDAWWAGYHSALEEGSDFTHTVRDLGAHTPYWWVYGTEVPHSWDQEPEIYLSILSKDKHAQIDILATAVQQTDKQDVNQHQRVTNPRLRPVKMDVGAWVAVVNNHIVDTEIQRQRWWYMKGRVEAILSKETGIE
jgi:predicted helicase